MNSHGPIRRRVIRAAAVADAAGTLLAPGVVVVEGDRVIAVGEPSQIGVVADSTVDNLSDAIVIPALINAHAHLDLTHLGPQPYDGDFTRWVDLVRAGRARDDAAIAASVRQGVRLARAGGTAAVGDIAGARSTTPTRALVESGLAGVSFLEVFGVGRTQAAAIDNMRSTAASMNADLTLRESGVRFGIQPHAPYSCGPDVYRAAAALGLPLSTHLAETTQELEFVRTGTGPLAEMLKRIGVWDDSVGGFGSHPVEHIANLVGDRSVLAAHVNYAGDQQAATLARSRVTVAYCPRASAYFGHPTGHRYREWLSSGINVALGTDSILCLDTADRISVLDEMCLLHRRDATDALTLLRMATINGAQALGLRESLFTVAGDAGQCAGLLALSLGATIGDAREALAHALGRTDPPRWVLGPIAGSKSWFAERS